MKQDKTRHQKIFLGIYPLGELKTQFNNVLKMDLITLHFCSSKWSKNIQMLSFIVEAIDIPEHGIWKYILNQSPMIIQLSKHSLECERITFLL